MIPLIDRKTHTKLIDIRNKMMKEGVQNLGDVFVPIGPDQKKRAPTSLKVLYVGRALLRGAHTPEYDDYDRAALWSEAVIDDLLIKGDPQRGPFWSFIREVVRRTLTSIGDDRPPEALNEVLKTIIAWSNMVKISDVRGNPYGRCLSMQADFSVELLKSEIKIVRPTAAVFVTGDYAEKEILFQLFGSDGWVHDSPNKDQNAIKADPSSGIPVIWTNHPQGMRPAGSLEKARSFCAEAISKALK